MLISTTIAVFWASWNLVELSFRIKFSLSRKLSGYGLIHLKSGITLERNWLNLRVICTMNFRDIL
jgi:hypothetical protein